MGSLFVRAAVTLLLPPISLLLLLSA